MWGKRRSSRSFKQSERSRNGSCSSNSRESGCWSRNQERNGASWTNRGSR
jgi:hypothetical protein